MPHTFFHQKFKPLTCNFFLQYQERNFNFFMRFVLRFISAILYQIRRKKRSHRHQFNVDPLQSNENMLEYQP